MLLQNLPILQKDLGPFLCLEMSPHQNLENENTLNLIQRPLKIIVM